MIKTYAGPEAVPAGFLTVFQAHGPNHGDRPPSCLDASETGGRACRATGAKTMISLVLRFFFQARGGLATLAAVLALVTVAPAFAQGTVKNTFGDWQQRCETPAGAKNEQCALVQNVAAEDRPNVTLLVIVLRTADAKSRLLRIVAPLGVLLPAGLGLKIDQTDVGRAGFVRCLPSGCVAEVVMDDTLLNQLKTGKTATFVVFQTPEEGIGIPVNLAGLDKGLAVLN